MRKLAMVISLLALSTGARAQITDFTPPTPLLGALIHNDVALAQKLLESGANPNEGRLAGLPPLFLAIARQNLPLLRLMVQRGVDLTARDRSGSSCRQAGPGAAGPLSAKFPGENASLRNVRRDRALVTA